jgi:thioredoxin-like negative regulator of GroEL
MKKIIRFTASWCQPCKALAMILNKVDSPYPIEVVDIDAQSDVAIEFGIRSVPTLVMIEDGAVLKKMVGVKSEEIVKEWING